MMKTTMLTGLLCLAMGCSVGVLPEEGPSETHAPTDVPTRPTEAEPLDVGPYGIDDAGSEVATHPRAGWYRLTLSLPLAPELPLTFLARVERDGALAWGEMEPLATGLRTKVVGPAVGLDEFRTLAVDEDFMVLPKWRFEDDVTVPAVATPWPGSSAVHIVDLVLRPYEVSPFLCGDAEGHLAAPYDVDLEGTTFTLVPMRDRRMLDTPPILDCDGTRVQPAGTE